ncbi:serine protease SP24D-like [Anticarsia gemmatalis]|uniref:serine protease SP24D-like n=1 Tax=Anticarsia gemmatalis TaxID=129554 RepID=UPI003F7626C6
MYSTKTLLTVLSLLKVTHAPVPPLNKGLRVINGNDDIPPKYPYVVCLLLLMRNQRFCTGTLIKPNLVLTAAHCVLNIPEQYIQWGDMSLKLNETQSKSLILKQIRHPNYEYFERTDIAIFIVNPVSMDVYGRLSAVDSSTLVGASVVFAGFGSTYNKFIKLDRKRKEEDGSRPLQVGEAVVKTCASMFQGVICLSPKCTRRQHAMSGDSGGPLFLGNKVVAVAYAVLKGRFANSGEFLYTPVSPYLNWIFEVISSNQ